MEFEILLSLLTLTILEIVLGVDNIIFIAILSGRLPEEQQARARTLGLAVAMLSRVVLLFAITLIMKLTRPWFDLLGMEFSGRDLILIVGGLFLLAKSTLEIHANLEGEEQHGEGGSGKAASFFGVILQIMVLDIVFSLDSVITAVGLSDRLWVMVTAIVIAVGVMMLVAGGVSRFIEKHPTIKILALSFLLLIGLALVGEGLDQHIPKGYIYFAMAFSALVEFLNMRMRRKRTEPVHLRQHLPEWEGLAE